MSLSQEDLELHRRQTEKLTANLRGEPLLQSFRDVLEGQGCSPWSAYLCDLLEDGDGGAWGLLVAADGTVVRFELRRTTCLSWTVHAEVGELGGEFRATEYAFALSNELREAAKSPGGLEGARLCIAPAEVVPRKAFRGKRPPPKKVAAKKAPTKQAPAKKAPAKKKPAAR